MLHCAKARAVRGVGVLGPVGVEPLADWWPDVVAPGLVPLAWHVGGAQEGGPSMLVDVGCCGSRKERVVDLAAGAHRRRGDYITVVYVDLGAA